MLNLLWLAASLFLLIKSSDYAIRHATELAQAWRLPRYTIGFLVVAVISILPETFIAIDSAWRGLPAFGLGTLFGSNVADLTLVFTIVILATTNGIKINSQILKSNRWYPLLLAVPILIGWDGHYSRPEGLLLIGAGLSFCYLTLKNNLALETAGRNDVGHRRRALFYLLLSLIGLILGSHLTVKYGVALAGVMNLSPVLIAMLVVGLGTTLPELFFSLRAVKHNEDELALGDVLGTVISDATIAVGIVALISPFYFPVKIIYVTAAFMVAASFVLLTFMRSGKMLTKKEGWLLLAFYVVFVLTEYFINRTG